MKLITPSLTCLTLATAHHLKDACDDLSTKKSALKCVASLKKRLHSALVMQTEKHEQVIDQILKDNEQMRVDMAVMKEKLEMKEQVMSITVQGDYHGTCDGENNMEKEEDPRMNSVPEFLKTPKSVPPSSMNWVVHDYHYYMNCVDEVELRIWTDFQKRDPNWPTVGPDIPTEPYFRVDPTNFTVGDLANEGFREILEAAPHPWGWSNIDAFGASAGAHGREMMSWATDEVKEFWKERNSWFKDDHQDIDWYLWGYVQNIRYKFCSGLPTYKRIWGTPIRQDGCNPKYPYTSWRNEGFNTTAEECDNEFIHEHPKSLRDDRFVTGNNLD